MSHRYIARVLRIGLAAMIASASAQTVPAPGQLARDVVFDQLSPLAKNSVLWDRLLSPGQRDRQVAAMAAKGSVLAPYPLDLSAERFLVYLPKHEPSAGYGLLVFIPPWENARLPSGWSQVLDREGMIFVTAGRSGNDESIPGRRIPLALTAAHALAERYRIDSKRKYISGFSGGSRVALRTAIAFPDIFAGVLLNSGSDPIGTAYDPLPSQDLMSLLQTRTRFVFVTGENDEVNVSMDAATRMSLSAWCVDATRAIVRPHVGHEVMDRDGLAEALGTLARPYPGDPAQSRRCLSSMDIRLQHARADAIALQAQPRSSWVREQLDRLDREFGALLDGETEPARAPSD